MDSDELKWPSPDWWLPCGHPRTCLVTSKESPDAKYCRECASIKFMREPMSCGHPRSCWGIDLQYAGIEGPKRCLACAEAALFKALKMKLPELERLLAQINGRTYEDGVYRFYHQSFKVFGRLQEATGMIVEHLHALAPERRFNNWFTQIVTEGTGKEFTHSDNDHWPERTRPIVEAFFHARYFLDMAVKYGRELQQPPSMLPSGWAAFLCLFDLR